MYFNGNIAKVSMWNIVLSSSDIDKVYNCGKINESQIQNLNLILNTNINAASWNGSEFNIPDLTGITAGYTSVNSEESDLLTDCP